MQLNDSRAESPAERTNAKRGRRWIAMLLWAIFGAGVLLQAVAPRLKIEHNAFVMPPELLSQGKAIAPAEIVARVRKMQLLSAVLALGGALGLASFYRRALFRSAGAALGADWSREPIGPAPRRPISPP